MGGGGGGGKDVEVSIELIGSLLTIISHTHTPDNTAIFYLFYFIIIFILFFFFFTVVSLEKYLL